MKTIRPIVWTVGAMTFLAVASAQLRQTDDQAAQTGDQILASFERSLNHVPAPATTVRRTAIEQDVLYALINKPLQSSDGNRANNNFTNNETLLAEAR